MSIKPWLQGDIVQFSDIIYDIYNQAKNEDGYKDFTKLYNVYIKKLLSYFLMTHHKLYDRNIVRDLIHKWIVNINNEELISNKIKLIKEGCDEIKQEFNKQINQREGFNKR